MAKASAAKASVIINYKSGIQVRVVVDEMVVNMRGPDLIEFTAQNMRPKPMFLGIGDIESIYQDVDSYRIVATHCGYRGA